MADNENLDRAVEQIRTRIDRTREHMGDTIEQIGAHLNPDHLKREFREGVREQVEYTKQEIRGATIGRAERLMHNVEETVNHTTRSLLDTIRDNPVPAAMAGIGIGWLIADNRRHHSHYDGRHAHREYMGGGIASTGPGFVSTTGYTAPAMTRTEQMRAGAAYTGTVVRDETENIADRARGAADEARDVAYDLASDARDAVDRVQDSVSGAARHAQHLAGDMVDRVQDTAEDAWRSARYQAQHAQRLAQDNPLAAGAVALALGFAAGMILPETPQEERWMGPTRDRLLDRAQDTARDTAQKVQRVA
jgi:ElaB/YqjD/DUF883 family membrane-anchored ribosome-binding protein